MVKVNNVMLEREAIKKIDSELKKGIDFLKCRKCGCMKETLKVILSSVSSFKSDDSGKLAEKIKSWFKGMKLIEYNCLGCKYCYPAMALNIFNEGFPEVKKGKSPSCDFKVRQKWPPVPGEYFAFCEGKTCPVAVSTLSSVKLAENLASIRPKGLCIVGKTETENIGIDKIIKNTVTNPTIRFFIVAGKDPLGHYSGRTLLALSKNGVDRNMKVIKAQGKQSQLRNVTFSEVEAFRRQVKLIDMIGCEDIETITTKINEFLKEKTPASLQAGFFSEASIVPKIQAEQPNKLKMDEAGYFVIIPWQENKTIIVEHYTYNNRLLHTIEGKDAVSIYSTIIANTWLTELNHAAYLGRELTKAELSLKYGFKYIQDKAT